MRNPEAQKIWIGTLLVMALGLVTLYSATYENVRVSHSVFFDQLFWVIVGILIIAVVSQVSYRLFFEIAYPFYFLSILLLVAVILTGHSALGATRWLDIGGLKFQPSELSKLSVIILLARYFSTRNPRLTFDSRSSFYAVCRDLLYPFCLVMLSFFLIFKQPDLGTALLIMGIFVVMVYVSGLNNKPFAWFCGVCALMVPVGWHFLKPYQQARVLVFMNPNIDPLGSGYTIIQSRIAIGSGQLLGKGWLAGTQNQLNFLPERHTDFIFSVIGEEWGFVGAMFLLACYFVLIYSGLIVAGRLKDKFAYLLAMGIVTILALQVLINISMTMGLSPVVGITLPLISFGRTSFLIFVVMIGILLNLSRRRRV